MKSDDIIEMAAKVTAQGLAAASVVTKAPDSHRGDFEWEVGLVAHAERCLALAERLTDLATSLQGSELRNAATKPA